MKLYLILLAIFALLPLLMLFCGIAYVAIAIVLIYLTFSHLYRLVTILKPKK